MKKFIITMVLAAAIITAVPAIESATDTTIISMKVDAASVITASEVAQIRSTWNSYPYVFKQYYNESALGRQCVKYAQHLLNVLNNAGITEDGIIGPASVKAIKAYQSSRGLVADGIIGDKTKAKLLSEAEALVKTTSTSNSSKLNFSNAYSYAKKYWNMRNSAYNYYSSNNCANFVSQCLVAAGMPTNSTFCNGSYSFVNVTGLKSYMQSKYGVAYKTWPSASSIAAGDVIYTNSGGHVMFVTKVSGGKVYASGNTNNRDELCVSISAICGVLKTSTLF